MERNNEKRRRGKYIAVPKFSPIVKYHDDNESMRLLENSWKYRQGNEITASNDRNERRQSNSAIDRDASYHYPTNVNGGSSRKDGLSNASRAKYIVPLINEKFYGIDITNNGTLKFPKNQFFRKFGNNGNYTNNVAVVRKNRYVDDFDEAKELEDSSFETHDNGAEETSEEIVDDEPREDATDDYNDKDYEEHEADDEIDEESDVLERPIDRTRGSRKIRMESLPRGGRISSAIVPSRYHRVAKISTGKTSERCCHSANDHETPEIPTEEEDEPEGEIREPVSSRKSVWRSRQVEETPWISARNTTDKYSDSPERSMTTNTRQARRPRTMRPEMEKITRSAVQHESCRNINKCDRCGGTSGNTPKTTSSRNATCRLQDSRYFIGEPIGGEIYEESSRMTYQTKPRRTKESRSVNIYETKEKGQTIDNDEDDNELAAIYKTCRGKNSRDRTNQRRSSYQYEPVIGTRKNQPRKITSIGPSEKITNEKYRK